jgi:hypothetical protein
MLLALYGIALAALAGAAVWCAAERWWHYLIVAVAWVPLFPLVATFITGDISRYLPPDAFAAGGDKDAFIWASIYATVMIAIALAAAALWAIKLGWRWVRE